MVVALYGCMEYAKLGKTGLNRSVISFGGIPIQRADAANTAEVVDQMQAHGIHFIDTARGYTVSEEIPRCRAGKLPEKVHSGHETIAQDYCGMDRGIDTSLNNLRTDHMSCPTTAC